MLNLLFFIIHLLLLSMQLLKSSGYRKLAAENLALRQQLLIISRRHKRSPKLYTSDRIIFGFLSFFISPSRLYKIAIIIKPATILRFHKALVKLKYHYLFSNKAHKKPGPKGPSQDIINAVLEMKKHNPRFGYRRIAMQIAHAFHVEIDKDIVRRILTKYNKGQPSNGGPSCLTFIGHMKDSLWSVDLFRCESIALTSHWVMVVMDQFTRRIIGIAVHAGQIEGVSLCCMFNKIIATKELPHYLSTDHDPLFKFHRWLANLRVLDIEEIKSIPYTPTSHPFIERLILTIRSECLDQLLFWNARDLENKLDQFIYYYNDERCHLGIQCKPPNQVTQNTSSNVIPLKHYQWKSYCNDLVKLPMAA